MSKLIAIYLCLMVFLYSGFLKKKSEPKPAPSWQQIEDNGKYDLVFRGSPIKSTRISRSTVTDAIENAPGGLKDLTTVVYFKINKMEKGKLPKVVSNPKSKSEQFQDALDEKDFKKVLLSDYDTKPTIYTRQRMRIAVTDPVKVFDFPFWDQFSKEEEFRIFLKKYQTDDTFVMMKSERLVPE